MRRLLRQHRPAPRTGRGQDPGGGNGNGHHDVPLFKTPMVELSTASIFPERLAEAKPSFVVESAEGLRARIPEQGTDEFAQLLASRLRRGRAILEDMRREAAESEEHLA